MVLVLPLPPGERVPGFGGGVWWIHRWRSTAERAGGVDAAGGAAVCSPPRCSARPLPSAGSWGVVCFRRAGARAV